MSESSKELSGRELDIAIAQRVMQWPRRDRDDDRDYEDTYFSAYNDGGQIVVFRGGSQRSAERWSPAQNIEAAMQVVEKMRERDYSIQINGYRRWGVTFVLESVEEPTVRPCGSKSLPEAICRAALAAMEQKS